MILTLTSCLPLPSPPSPAPVPPTAASIPRASSPARSSIESTEGTGTLMTGTPRAAKASLMPRQYWTVVGTGRERDQDRERVRSSSSKPKRPWARTMGWRGMSVGSGGSIGCFLVSQSMVGQWTKGVCMCVKLDDDDDDDGGSYACSDDDSYSSEVWEVWEGREKDTPMSGRGSA